MTTNYEKGRRLEYRALEIFRGMEDCIYATRTPGSKSHADIIAIFKGRKTGVPRIVLAQCKYGEPKISEMEMAWLFGVRAMGIGALIIWRPKGGKEIFMWDLEEATRRMKITPARRAGNRKSEINENSTLVKRLEAK